jgi:hypothetical protein
MSQDLHCTKRFTYCEDTELHPHTKKIIPAIDEKTLIRRVIPDSVRQVILNNSNDI